MALCTLIDDGRESGGHRRPQAPGQIGRHIRTGEQLQAQFRRVPPPTQLLHDVPQRMP
jgi:hypothetical protein